MKRDQIILIVSAVLLAVVTVVAGWFLMKAVAERNAAAENCTMAYEEVQGIYQAKVFPNAENIARIKDDQRLLEEWLGTASNLLHRGDVPDKQSSPTGFKQKLQATVRVLSAHQGIVQGKVVRSGFHFGFDRYLGESDSLPQAENVARLSNQLTIIERISKELYAANIMELRAVTRETFDDKEGGAQNEEATTRRSSRRRRDTAQNSAVAEASAGPISEYFSRQRFSFEFQARPEVLIDVLNRLAAMELFVVVSEVEFKKTSDPLSLRSAKKETGRGPEVVGMAVKDPAQMTHVERIVTDPQLEPPVTVKLEIYVYAFEGV